MWHEKKYLAFGVQRKVMIMVEDKCNLLFGQRSRFHLVE